MHCCLPLIFIRTFGSFIALPAVLSTDHFSFLKLYRVPYYLKFGAYSPLEVIRPWHRFQLHMYSAPRSFISLDWFPIFSSHLPSSAHPA